MKLEIRPRSAVQTFAVSLLLLATACGGSPADAAMNTEGALPQAAATDGASGPGASASGAGTGANVGAVSSPGVSGDGTTAAPVAPPAGAAAATPMPYRGVNLAGAEFGDVLPGVEGVDYTFPTTAEVDYFLSKGMNTFRLGFKWERLQPQANGELAEAYATKLDALVADATAKGATVILNPHNFARYYGVTVGSPSVPDAVFANLWQRLATRYGQNPRVMFNLVNEPHDIPTEQWVSAANAAIAAIRGAAAQNTIIVPGNGWTGAHSWSSASYGTPNSVAMLAITDPSNNVLFEAHQYLDANSGGGGGPCVSTTIGSERLAGFVQWLRDNGKKGFVGEFAGRNDATCNAAVTDMLTSMMGSSDVLVGWLWWAAGPWRADYPFVIDPKDGLDRPAMALLKPFLF